MDTQRLILFFVFSFSILLLWEAWQKETRAPQQLASSAEKAASTPTPTPQISATPAAKAGVPAVNAAAADTGARVVATSGERIRVDTDLLRVEIDTLGGSLVYAELLQHKDANDRNKNLILLGPEHRYSLQSGLIGANLPNHTTKFSSAVKQATLAPGADRVEVRLEAVSPDGIKVTKIIGFQRNSYLVDVRHEIENASNTPLATHAYYQLVRDGKSPADDNSMAPTYTGATIFTEQEKFQKIAFSDIDKNKASHPKTPDTGWVAIIQHHFVTALLPQEKGVREIYTRKVSENLYAIGMIFPLAAIAPGAKAAVSVPAYIGPQEQSRLKLAAPGLDLVVDYGWLTVIAAPLFWVLEWFFNWTGNWGIAIILLTVVIKLIFYPLSAASYKSMAKMKLVAPRLAKFREMYPDDRTKQNQAMMELYKTEKINPLGGCLPILVQIPVFISLYWVLLAAVELRHAPFYGWITDLAAIDPWYVLPALMMASMIIQTKLNPTPPDPVQAKVMQIMPFAFGIMFFFFPAGLVLYWLVNNILSILQQWQISNMIEGAKPAAPKR
ncbi:MAG: membrane protein insertase YidC [Betaproteobacteria bacterium RIFCSPLOWO2_02_FULL_62_17]|nr:MAG: membrane protein insertase YidC [Betaproteobacteria bacterium RIFCSPLOWO2_02_FULL_62_17]